MVHIAGFRMEFGDKRVINDLSFDVDVDVERGSARLGQQRLGQNHRVARPDGALFMQATPITSTN
jgi:hypothetical protein